MQNNSIVTTQATSQDLEFENKKLKKLLAKSKFEKLAIKSLLLELGKKLDLGEVINTICQYLWETIDYRLIMFIIYNPAVDRFESRAYLKKSVSNLMFDKVRAKLIQFLNENGDQSMIGTISSSGQVNPLMYGLKIDDKIQEEGQIYLLVPLKIDEKVIGAFCVINDQNQEDNPEVASFVETMIAAATVSIARIQTLLSSLYSRIDTLLQSLSDGVIMFDRELNVTLANPTASKITGLAKQGYKLPEIYQLFPALNLDQQIDQSFENKAIIKIDKAELRQSFYEIFLVPIKNSYQEILGGALIFHDITHLAEVDQAKTEFVSLASHQLKTPLSLVKWYAEILLSGDVGVLTDLQKKQVQTIYDGNNRMIELVNALLNVSRLELGTFMIEPEPCMFSQICQDVLAELTPQIKVKNLKITEDYQNDLPFIQADKNLLRIIFQNLLSNACKYTPQDGQITIKIKLCTHEPQEDRQQVKGICLEIKDTGYGIPESQQDQVFSKLFRADNVRVKETDGTGLGLYIIKQIIDQSDGQISFESKENEGTTFRVWFPETGMKKKIGTKALN